jgi:Fe-S-cluster containining protein
MFAVGNVLVSDNVLEAPFACHLGACLGGCCVVGTAGAPLEPDERGALERALPSVRKQLSPEALDIVDEHGPWETLEDGRYATRCVGSAECVFVTYEGPIAKCSLQKAYHAGRIDFEKPLSCHLYPIRILRYGDYEALTYEQIGLCAPAVVNGKRLGTSLIDFLREPLVRTYGEAWYEQFREACALRRKALGLHRDSNS